ncbi:hypothetical protein IFM89_017971 [Coptis chinensis]|uniref:Uncharacterized protein n=1 Tax=Coptis chinensis TaxID=261450 RepID=A0A835HWH1_9MAGN|nr:hypothetical protein IFM89_017971 [Coptis chinensis]
MMFQMLLFHTFVLVLIGLNGILLVTSEKCPAGFYVEYPFQLNSGDGVIYSRRPIYSGDGPNYSDKYNNNNNNNNTNTNTNIRSYAPLEAGIPNGFNGYSTCVESVVVPFAYTITYVDSNPDCESSEGRCQYNSTGFRRCHCRYDGYDNCWRRQFDYPAGHGLTTTVKVIIGVSTGVGGLVGVVLLILLVLYKKIISRVGGVVLLILLVLYRKIISSLCSCWRDITESLENEEVFSENYNCGPQRYNYSAIKKMTNSFKDTLGKGGYGCVFKGQLRDGRLVAVKD